MHQKLPLILSLMLSLFAVAIPAATQPLSGQERMELQICRAAAKQDVAQCTAGNVGDPSTRAYEKYLGDYYRQEIDLKALNNRIVAWQIFAANMILALVSFVAVAGVALAAYQLYISAKLPSRAGETGLELGFDRLRIQTGVIGVVILVLSAVLLLAYMRSVYDVRVVGSVVAKVVDDDKLTSQKGP